MNNPASHPEVRDWPVPPKLAPPARRGLLLLLITAVIAAGGLLFFFNPVEHQFYPICFFHTATGLQCPGCGGTRALHQLLHGNVLAALHLNALVVVAVPLLAWWGIRFGLRHFRGLQQSQLFPPKWLWCFIALGLAYSALRNLPTFAWLAP